MDILDNPFHILGASTRDNRQQLMSLSEERSLLAEDDLGVEAVSILTNPRKRLKAELSWLLGMAPKRAEECINQLRENPIKLLHRLNILSDRRKKIKVSPELGAWLRDRRNALEQKRRAEAAGESYELNRRDHDPKLLDKKLQKELHSFMERKKSRKDKLEIPAIARVNLAAALLDKVQTDLNLTEISMLTMRFAECYDDIDLDSTLLLINEERGISDFPPISEVQDVESELYERRKHCLVAIRSMLDQLPSSDLVEVVTSVVETITDDGETHAPILVDDLVDAFEVHAQEFFEIETGNIRKLIEQIRSQASDDLNEEDIWDNINLLERVVKNWDLVAQPIQVSARSRGLTHDLSQELAHDIRSLAIDLFNDFNFMTIAQRLTELNKEVFAEVDEVVERSIEDSEALEEIAEQREYMMEEAAAKAEEWRESITYQADVGVVFKDKLSISPDGIVWKGRKWDLDSITRTRWGGTRHSINGVPSGTTYKIFFGDSYNGANIELRKSETFNNFIECLWRSVGVRLLTEFLEGLRAGRKYSFGSGLISDQGIELERKKMFSRNEKVFCDWSELVIWNAAGSFAIGKKEDKDLIAAGSYQDDDNIHVIEAAIRMFWKRGGSKLSSLLDG